MRRRALLRAAGLGAGALALPVPGTAAAHPGRHADGGRSGDPEPGPAHAGIADGYREVSRFSPVDRGDGWDEIWSPARTLHDVTVVGDRAYCCFWEAGTWILDVSEPANPSFLGRAGHYSLAELRALTDDVGGRQRAYLEAPGNAHYADATADGELLAVGAEGWSDPYTDARGPGGIRLFDVSDPATPELLGRIAPPRAENETRQGTWVTAHNFEVRGDRLYSSWYQGGVKLHDVSDPSDPTLLAWWRDPEVARFWTARAAAGGTFVATSYPRDGTEGRLYVFPDRPGRQPDPPPLSPGPAATPGTPTATPTPNPTPPPGEGPFEPLGSVAVEGAAEAVVGPDGRTAYVATGDGFAVVDLGDPAAPTVVAERRGLLADRPDGPLESVLDVAVDGDRLLVAAPTRRGRLRGLVTYDVSEPADPRQVGDFYEFPSRIHNADLSAGYAYLTANDLPGRPLSVVQVPGGGSTPGTDSPAPTRTPTGTAGGGETNGSGDGNEGGDGDGGDDGGSAGAPGFGVLAALGGVGLGAYRHLRRGEGD